MKRFGSFEYKLTVVRAMCIAWNKIYGEEDQRERTRIYASNNGGNNPGANTMISWILTFSSNPVTCENVVPYT